jgi:hypothetical protein
VKGKILASSFFVVPGSRRTIPALKSTCAHRSDRISLFRQPVIKAKIAGPWFCGRRCFRTLSSWSRPKKPLPSVILPELLDSWRRMDQFRANAERVGPLDCHELPVDRGIRGAFRLA